MKRFLTAAFTALMIFSGVSSFAAEKAAAEAKQAQELPGGLKAVETKDVCMVNNTHMGKTQIPVKVEGKTYYGCCEGCVAKLKKNRSLRYSKDPVTGTEVDKAKAFITVLPNGTTLYFESALTAQAFKMPESK